MLAYLAFARMVVLSTALVQEVLQSPFTRRGDLQEPGAMVLLRLNLTWTKLGARSDVGVHLNKTNSIPQKAVTIVLKRIKVASFS